MIAFRLRTSLVLSAVLAAVVFGLSGCTAAEQITQTQTRLRNVEDFRHVESDAVSSSLNTYRKDDEDEVLYHLERGMLTHYQERWKNSAQHFQEADRAIERHYTKDIGKNIGAFLVNDLQLAYTGASYENIYLSSFNCLNYLQRGDVEGALVEMRRITHKLELLNDRNRGLAASLAKRDTAMMATDQVDKKLEDVDLLTEGETPPELRQNSALGRLLTTVLYGKTGASDDARIELQKLRTALEDQGRTGYLHALSRASERRPSPSAPPGSSSPASSWEEPPALLSMIDVEAALANIFTGGSSAEPEAPVAVPSPSQLTEPTAFNTLFLSFTGEAPRKTERSFNIPLIIDDEEVFLHFSVPILETPTSKVDRVRAMAAGDTLRVPMVEDLQSVAQQMFEQRKPVLYTRAVVRSFLKAGLTEGAEHLAREKGGEAAGLVVELIGSLMSSQAAQADTRAWQTMPGRAHALAARLPAGTHTITFEFLSEQDHVLKRRTRTVTVQGEQDLALAESIYLE